MNYPYDDVNGKRKYIPEVIFFTFTFDKRLSQTDKWANLVRLWLLVLTSLAEKYYIP